MFVRFKDNRNIECVPFKPPCNYPLVNLSAYGIKVVAKEYQMNYFNLRQSK